MQLGMIGLGRMGGNMVRRLMRNGHDCVVFDLDPSNVSALATEGASGAGTLDAFVAGAHASACCLGDGARRPADRADRRGPRLAHAAGRHHHRRRQLVLSKTMCDGRLRLKAKGIHYVDVGTSGGVWGLERGYCLMIGGRRRPCVTSIRSSRRWRPDGGIASYARPRESQRHRRTGVSPLRTARRRPFREDDSQRHRVRSDAGVCGRLRHPQERHLERSCRGASVQPQSRGHR